MRNVVCPDDDNCHKLIDSPLIWPLTQSDGLENDVSNVGQPINSLGHEMRERRYFICPEGRSYYLRGRSNWWLDENWCMEGRKCD